jgi:hypothetical protein
VRNADYKSMEGLAKSESSEDFGADVGDEENSHGWQFSDASHRERSEFGEMSTLVLRLSKESKRRDES